MGQPTGDFRQDGLRARAGEVVTGDLLLTIGTPDGSEVRHRPDDVEPEARRVRAEAKRAASGPVSADGPRALSNEPADLALLDREADIAQLLGLLAEGRSVRLVGPAGSGRSALLAAVAVAAGDIAPDGVVRLSGHRRTADDLLQELFAAAYQAPGFRPERSQLTTLLQPVGAVVVIDDVEPFGEELEELLAMAPECAFLIAVPPGRPKLPANSRLTDHPVAGLSRPACLALVSRLTGRELDSAERAWAVDLWFESEGLPQRFVQAAALLRQRDISVDALVAAREDRRSVFGAVVPVEEADDPAVLEGQLRRQVPLPSVAESAAPAARLANGLSDDARRVLDLALALGGECPAAPHLPALIDVGLGESALRELVDCGLVVSVGAHHRLTRGALAQVGDERQPGEIAYGAAEHLCWWVVHSSVGVEQIAAEAEVIIGALLADRAAERPQAVLKLARAAAPALALSLRWGAWERVLQLGLEAARRLRSTADEAWFHHELGALAFATGARHRATAELESAVALRAALTELRANAAARRMLDLLRAGALELPPAPDGTGTAGRRPVIRAIAQAPFRLRQHNPGDTGRVVLAASAAVMALGVLGTAIGLSVAGPTSPADHHTRPGTAVDDAALPDVGSGSPTPTPVETSSDSTAPSPSTSPDESSTHESRKPTASKTTAVPDPTTPTATQPAPQPSTKTPTTPASTATDPSPIPSVSKSSASASASTSAPA